MRRALKVAIACAALLAGLALAFGYHAATWLKQSDTPAQADAIIVLSGRYERAMHAADLYRAGLAPVVVLSEPVRERTFDELQALGITLPTATEIQRRVLQAKGVPPSAVRMLPGKVLSTADEAAAIAAQYGKPGARLLVVTSPSHLRRARMILERALAGRDATLMVCATPYESFPDDWWRSQDAARDVVLEWAKIVFFLVGGRFSAAAAA